MVSFALPALTVTQPEPPKTKTRIAICGSSASSIGECPIGHPDWEIWSINELWRNLPAEKCTRWFDFHSRQHIDENYPEHLEWLKKLDPAKPPYLYMQQAFDDIPAAQVFPQVDILNKFGPYFTSSIAWMLAYAIMQNPAHIGVWGVDMLHETEYAYQRAGCDYYIGYARGAGIPVYLPESSALARAAGLYGYSRTAMRHRDGDQRFIKRKKDLENARNNSDTALKNLDGQLSAIHQFGLKIQEGDDAALLELPDLWIRTCETHDVPVMDEQIKWLRHEIANYRQKLANLVSERREEALKYFYTADGSIQELNYWRDIFKHLERGGV